MLQKNFPIPKKAGDRVFLGNLHQCSRAYAIADIANQSLDTLLVITPDTQTALVLYDELRFFINIDEEALHQIYLFPDWEILPYDSFSSHHSIVSQRLKRLYHLLNSTKPQILIVSMPTLMHSLCPKSYLESTMFLIDDKESFKLEERCQQLQKSGYRRVDTVYEHGEFAVRGSLMDLFPMGSLYPFRIDLFDETIDSIRTFDTETQRSIKKVDSIQVLPGHEFSMTPEGRDNFCQRFREQFSVNYREVPLYKDIRQGISSQGIEYYLPLFFEKTATLFDYLPQEALVITYDACQDASNNFWQDVNERYQNRKQDVLRPILSPNQIIMPPDELNTKLKQYRQIRLSRDKLPEKQGRYNFLYNPLPDLTIRPQSTNPIAGLQSLLESGIRVLFVAESAGRREIFLEALAKYKLYPVDCLNWHEFYSDSSAIGITLGMLEQGVQLIERNISIIPESLLSGQKVVQKRSQRANKNRNFDNELIIRNLTELKENAPVVHIEHGIGRYLGLQKLTVGGQEAEFVMLEYAQNSKLYVPVFSLHLIARYTGADEEKAPLHRLGSEKWDKARKKAAEKARDTAAELLDIYARREARKGFAFSKPDVDYQEFCRSFPFEETEDQLSTIADVVKDMTASTPMDRLVCGDVGFGKTEVAMRAAFLAVQSHKQVVILVPTTLLAQQHYESFRDRFALWPFLIEVMSRFKSAKQLSEVKQKLRDGQVDIIIGTHKLLQKDIAFKRLGLLIIDEEHRFGVRHKEKLKSLRSEVDILALTATPIPRTLNMAMSGVRDLSIIATPPARRLSINTFIRKKDNAIIKEAIFRELLRGGQVFYLHNEVSSIEKVADELASLIPEARVTVGHGQMREKELEQVMTNFYHKRYNVLVCTTIIETGIDIPNANTIIINRADKFGLAQLHQLRGRVGRSHHQAYAYMMVPDNENITVDAEKRLHAIEEANDFGSGFMLASNDLEIRGAGELLGDGQSGQIQSVGFTLYNEMLEKAVNAIQKGERIDIDQPLQQNIEINLQVPTLFPDDYIYDVHTRLTLYKRLAVVESDEDIDQLKIELIDRFGLLPDSAKYLFRQTALRLVAEQLKIRKIYSNVSELLIEFSDQPNVDQLAIIKMVQSNPSAYKLQGNRLKYIDSFETSEQRFTEAENLLKAFLK